MTLPPDFLRPDGTVKSFDERMRDRRKAVQRAEQIRQQVQQQTARATTVSPHASRIAELRRELDGYPLPARRAQIERRLAVLVPEQERWEQQQAEQARQNRFAADPAVKLVRESAEAVARSWQSMYPFASEEAVQVAIELARSTAWDDPADLSRAYWSALSEIEEANLQSERSAALELDANAAKAEAEAMRAKARVAEGEKRKAMMPDG